MFNLRGKIASVKERRPGLIDEQRAKVAKLVKVVGNLEKKALGSAKLHQKKRRLEILRARLESLEADQAAGFVRLCFGGRKLFRKQFALEANGYDSLDQWRSDWHAARASQFFVLGSRDETAGCQGCVASESDDDRLSLRLRLPKALAGIHGSLVRLDGVRFAYGHDTIQQAMRAGTRIRRFSAHSGQPYYQRTGVAISYRFLRDEKGWRVFVSLEVAPPTAPTSRLAGAVGIDINADHWALGEVDRHGNLVRARHIECVTYGLDNNQASALIGDRATDLARGATDSGKPVVIEALNFSRKRAELEAASPKAARMLSGFAYNKTVQAIKAACFRAGVEVIEVNPAYTSVIGAINHARRRGISVHPGAALAIARRGLSLSERPAVPRAIVPVRNGGHVTFDLPVRNRSRHVWSFWSQARKRLTAAHAAHVRSGDWKYPPAPLPRALGATWALPARLRHASQQHCSAGGIEDEPLPDRM